MSLGVQIGVNGLAVRLADARDIPLHEGAPFTERRRPRGSRILALQAVHRRHDAFGVFHARRHHHGRHRFRHRGEEMQRLPAEFGISLDRHGGEFRRGELHEDVGARGLELGDLGVDAGVGHLVRRLGHDRNLAAEAVLQALQVILAETVVLIKHRDLAARMVLQQILRIDVGFGLVARQEAHGPGKLARLVPHRRAGGDEELRDLLRVQIGMDGLARVGAEARQDEENVVFLDELAGRLHRLGRIVGVVIGNEIDLAASDAALGVDLVEIGRQHLADHAIGGSRTGIGHGVADADLVGARRRSGPARKPAPAIAASISAVAALRRGAVKSRRMAVCCPKPGQSLHSRTSDVDRSHCSPPCEPNFFVIYFERVMRAGSVSTLLAYSPTMCLNWIDFVASAGVTQDMVSRRAFRSQKRLEIDVYSALPPTRACRNMQSPVACTHHLAT